MQSFVFGGEFVGMAAMAVGALAVLLFCSWAYYHPTVLCHPEMTRGDFPTDFVFGAGTSAFQYEGAWDEDGKTPSIWDTYTHEGWSGKSMADVASDGYHKYKEDIKLMGDTGLEAYRLSISWPRLLPSGRGSVNPKGLEYYNNVIDELIKHGIQPHITLHHLDIPQALQDEYGGWLSPKFIDDFKEFADVCFREFGDRVSHWTTMNEPNINAMSSFDYGFFPPGRCSFPFGDNCVEGNSTVEPYIAAHNMILAHSAAVELYRTKYQAIQKGFIGINIYCIWFTPLTSSIEDATATKNAHDFMLGWILNPLVYGDYPEIMKKNAGSRLPSFTNSESQQVKGSYDFIGINYYFTLYVTYDSTIPKTGPRDFTADMFAKFTDFKDVPPIGKILPPSHATKDYHSLGKMLNHLKNKYKNPPIYVHENGFGYDVVDSMDDVGGIAFLSGFIGSMLDAIRDGSDLRGYFVWAFVDVYELINGYSQRFGLYHVDFENPKLERTPRLSAHWYANFLRNGSVANIESFGKSARPSL